MRKVISLMLTLLMALSMIPSMGIEHAEAASKVAFTMTHYRLSSTGPWHGIKFKVASMDLVGTCCKPHVDPSASGKASYSKLSNSGKYAKVAYYAYKKGWDKKSVESEESFLIKLMMHTAAGYNVRGWSGNQNRYDKTIEHYNKAQKQTVPTGFQAYKFTPADKSQPFVAWKMSAPTMSTVLKYEGGAKKKQITENTTLYAVDTVTYKNLTPGLKVTVTGQLMRKSTKGKVATATSKKGGTVTTITSTVPSSGNAAIKVYYKIPAKAAWGNETLSSFITVKTSEKTMSEKVYTDDSQNIKVSTNNVAPDPAGLKFQKVMRYPVETYETDDTPSGDDGQTQYEDEEDGEIIIDDSQGGDGEGEGDGEENPDASEDAGEYDTDTEDEGESEEIPTISAEYDTAIEEGAKFQIWHNNYETFDAAKAANIDGYQRKYWAEATQPATGSITISGLCPGKYHIKQTNGGKYEGDVILYEGTTANIEEDETLNLGTIYDDLGPIAKVKVIKADSDTDEPLQGAVFEIKYLSAKTYKYNGKEIKQGDIVETITTGEDGTVTSPKCLTVGTYQITEKYSPDGYLPNKSYSQIVQIAYDEDLKEFVFISGDDSVSLNEHDDIADKSVAGADIKCINTEIEPAYEMYKVRTTEAPIKKVQYGFYALDEVFYDVHVRNTGNIEITMDVRDEFIEGEDGFSEPKLVDVIFDGEGTWNNKDSEDDIANITLQPDEEAVVTFSAIVKDEAKEYLANDKDDSDSLNADEEDVNMKVQENKTDDEDGYINKAYTENVSYPDPNYPEDENKRTPMDDDEDIAQTPVQKPDLGTYLTDEAGNKTTVSSKETVLIDTVKYEGLDTRKWYRIEGTLMVKDTGDPLVENGEEIKVTSDPFQPIESEGMIDIKFTIDTTNLIGKEIVAFETAYRLDGYNEEEPDEEDIVPVPVAEHKDIDDEAQTVHIPDLSTTAKDAKTGDNVVSMGKKTKIIDTVKYTNLSTEEEYTVKGRLMDKSTGKPLKIDGKEVTASRKFTPKKSDGEIDITFIVDTEKLNAKTLVAFEELYVEDDLVAEHKDIDDEDQTVYKPGVKTTAKVNGKKIAKPSKKTIIIDTVKYKNLVVGKKYTITGQLMLKSNGKKFGKPVSRTFTAKTANGSIDLKFTEDTTSIRNGKIVAFEVLTHNKIEVAEHKDIDDNDQTVIIESNKPGPGPTPPRTGDGIIYIVLIGAAAISALIAGAVALKRRKM